MPRHPVEAPRVEGTVVVEPGRRLGYAEFGDRGGRPVFWFHGTPGARRQVPPAARRLAREAGVRLIGVERPGVGDSTAHLYPTVAHFADDVAVLADRLDADRFGVIGMSGGGPYALACAALLPSRVAAAAILGGVGPTRGEEATAGGPMDLAVRFAPAVHLLHRPMGLGLSAMIRSLHPVASPAFDLFMRLSPPGDREVFRAPGMKEMFLDDMLRGSRRQLRSLVYDVVLFTRPWGFYLRDIDVPVRFVHGDADHIVPLSHGEHQARLVRGAELWVRPGQSHLGGLGAADVVLEALLDAWEG